MDKTKLAMAPFAAAGVFAAGWYGGREYYEHHQIADAVADLDAVKQLPSEETGELQPIPERVEDEVQDLFGQQPEVMHGAINRDGTIVFVTREEVEQTDYDTIVGHFRTEARDVVDNQGEFAIMTGEISLGVVAAAGLALAVRKGIRSRRERGDRHEVVESQEPRQPREPGKIRKAIRGLFELKKVEPEASEEADREEELVGAGK